MQNFNLFAIADVHGFEANSSPLHGQFTLDRQARGMRQPGAFTSHPPPLEHPNSNHRPSVVARSNCRAAKFYDRVHRLYPLVDWFCATARRQVIEHINQQPAGRLLEIGVGPGRHLRLYQKHILTAIDCSAKMVASCRRYSPQAVSRQMDGEHLALRQASFDYVALFHVLSVTAHPARMLAEASRVLRPGGQIFILNHETPTNAWRHVDTLLAPCARWLRFRSQFRLADIGGFDRFRRRTLPLRAGLGLIKAYILEK